MNVLTRWEDQVLIVTLQGRLDAYHAPDVRQRLLWSLDEAARLVVDLSGVTFVDSNGLAALVAGQRQTQVLGSRLCLILPVPEVAVIFALTHLDRCFTIASTISEAVRLVQGD